MHIKKHYVDTMNASQVFNYAVQMFQSVNLGRKLYSEVKFSQSYSIHLSFKTEKSAEAIEIKPYHSIIISKEGGLHLENDSDHPHFKSFVAGVRPDLTFREIANKLDLPITEIFLYTRHLLYYKKAILIEKLDDFSYFMLHGEFNAYSIVLAEQKIYRDFGQPSNLGICSYLSFHKSWAQIKHRYLGPTLDLQTLILMLCQFLSKNLITEVHLYMKPLQNVQETDESPTSQKSSSVGQVIADAAQRELSVKAMLSEGFISEKDLSKELIIHKDNYEFFFKFS